MKLRKKVIACILVLAVGMTSFVGYGGHKNTIYAEETTSYTENYYVETPDAEEGYSGTATSDNGKTTETVTTYEGRYYLEVEDQSSSEEGLVTIYDIYAGQDIKYKLVDSYTSAEVAVGSTAEILDKSTTDYSAYDLMNPTTGYPSVVNSVADDGSTVVYQFYRLKPKYTVKYYTVVPEGTQGAKIVNVNGTDKYYKLEDVTFEKVVEDGTWIAGAPINGTDKVGIVESSAPGVIVEGSEQGFSGYEFSQDTSEANEKLNTMVYRDRENLIEIFYDKLPTYTVKYYIEVKATENYDVSVEFDGNIKYYIIKTEETFKKEALTGTIIDYAVVTENTDKKAGVRENGTNVNETFKSFDKYEFSIDYTFEHNRFTGEVSGTEELVIELFYNKELTSYKEKYYIEVITNPNDGSEIDTIGDKTYKVITNTVPYVPIDTKAEITDKSDIYSGYKLLDSTTDKPWIVDDIDDEGQSVVYQVYDLPTYEIKYYKEVASNIEGAIEVDGKYYVLQSEDTVVNKATSGTEISTVKKDKDTVTVKEGDTEIANKSYDKYEFSQTSTDERGKASLTVSKDVENVVEIFYNKIQNEDEEDLDTEEPSTEEPSTEEPSTEEPSTEEPSTEEPSTEEPSTEIPSTSEDSTIEWKTDENGTFYETEDGTRITGWHEMKEDVWYYFDENGYRQTDWVKNNGSWYYLNENGVMQTGWIKDGGTWYYLSESGAMMTSWIKDGGTWYYLSESGAMNTGWIKDSGIWYYLSESGAMNTGWLKYKGTWYYLSGSGAMQTGWIQLGANWFYLNTNGAMAADIYIGKWYVDKNGYYIPSRTK